MKSETKPRFVIVFLLFVVNVLECSAVIVRHANLPGPLVYVVTPSSKTNNMRDPMYNYMRRIDSESTSQDVSKTEKTSDLIFADFPAQSGVDMASLRKVLQKEADKPTTEKAKIKTPDLIFAEFEADSKNQADNEKKKSIKNLLGKEKNAEWELQKAPRVPLQSSTTSTTTMTLPPMKVEDIWHVINKQKDDFPQQNMWSPQLFNPYALPELYTKKNTATSTTTTTEATAEETKHDDEKSNYYSNFMNYPINPYDSEITTESSISIPDVSSKKMNETRLVTNGPIYWREEELDQQEDTKTDDIPSTEEAIYETSTEGEFLYTGLGSQTGNSVENESRAIRTESNIKFPYVNLKTLQLHNSNNKMSNKPLYTTLDKMKFEKYPMRGEAQDIVVPTVAKDRYNPAQAYLPSFYKNKYVNKDSPAPVYNSPSNLVPPPPPLPPPPPSPSNVLTLPTNYDSFPPYAPPAFPPKPISPPAMPPPMPPTASESKPKPPPMTYDSGYTLDFPPNLASDGYSYDAPPAPPPDSNDDSPPPPPPDNNNKPVPPSYQYSKPASTYGHDYPKAVYHKPPVDYYPHPPPYHHDDDDDDHKPNYPELIYGKDPSIMSDSNDMMSDHGPIMSKPAMVPDDGSVDMQPPPPASPDKPMDDQMDFDHHHFKFPDFDHDSEPYDDHHYHHHHHTTTTTTTTTEMPRVNRFSYYYLGKKLYYLPLYFSVYFICYVGALIIKAVLRHKIVYPQHWSNTATRRTAREALDNWKISSDTMHDMTRLVTNGLIAAAEKYMKKNK